MFIKVLIISVILVAIVILALGVKLLFDKNAKFSAHSCALEDGNLNEDGTCAGCDLKDLADCPENTENK